MSERVLVAGVDRRGRAIRRWHSSAPKRRREAISRLLRNHVLERDGYRCVHCGETAEEVAKPAFWKSNFQMTMHIDHIIPHTFFGPTKAWNLVTSCPRCNLSRQHRGFDLVLLAQTHQREAAAA